MSKVVFLPAAADDFIEALNWYADRSMTVAERFDAAIHAAIEKIVSREYGFGKERYHTGSARKSPYLRIHPPHEECPMAIALSAEDNLENQHGRDARGTPL